MWVLRDHKNTQNYDCLFKFFSGNLLFVPITHRLLGQNAPRRAGISGFNRETAHLRTATSFLKAWNCSGVGSTTFRTFTATSPGNKNIKLPPKLLKMQLSFHLQNIINEQCNKNSSSVHSTPLICPKVKISLQTNFCGIKQLI